MDCPLCISCTRISPLRGEPPTGEPDAGDPHVRFGGRGSVSRSPYPYFSVVRLSADWVEILFVQSSSLRSRQMLPENCGPLVVGVQVKRPGSSAGASDIYGLRVT